MTDLRALGSSLLLGVAVAGVELLSIAEWVAKPAVGGVIGLAFFYLQRRLKRAHEQEKAAQDEEARQRRELAQTLGGLRSDLDRLASRVDLALSEAKAPAADAAARIAALERDFADLKDRFVGTHATWNRRHDTLASEMSGLLASTGATKGQCDALRARLDALENRHA